MRLIANQILGHGQGSKVLKLLVLIGYVSYLKNKGEQVEFIYTPLSREGFGTDFFFNDLGQYSAYGKSKRTDYIALCDVWDAMLGYKGKKLTDETVEFKIRPDIDGMEEYTRIHRSEIKELFNLPKKVASNKIEVAVHIRRGDVNIRQHPDRWIGDEAYINILNTIKKTLGDKCNITIYTQRGNFNAPVYSGYNIVYDTETQDHEVWCKLVNSDILVMGKSAFSYSAGLMNDGLGVFIDGHHAKASDWCTIENLEVAIRSKYEI